MEAMDYSEWARQLFDDWYLCDNARVIKNVVDLQLEKDYMSKVAHDFQQTWIWGDSEEDLAKACAEFEPKLKRFKEKIVFEILRNGTV